MLSIHQVEQRCGIRSDDFKVFSLILPGRFAELEYVEDRIGPPKPVDVSEQIADLSGGKRGLNIPSDRNNSVVERSAENYRVAAASFVCRKNDGLSLAVELVDQAANQCCAHQRMIDRTKDDAFGLNSCQAA